MNNLNTAENYSDFLTLIKQNSAKAFNFAYRLTGNEQNARDLVQQTLTNALKYFERYERSRPFAPWFNQILKNLFLDEVRKIKCRRTVSLDGPSPFEDTTWEQLLPGSDRTPLEQLEKIEMNELIRKALDLLPEAYRVVVDLCDVERFSYQRIATFLNCPIGTVRSRIHQGRILMKLNFAKLTA
jgi:RNA polymerase sigma-70 factor, ECF subfamily